MLIKGMTEQEIRVLQEFRRVAVETLTSPRSRRSSIRPAAARSGDITDRQGLLTTDAARENFALTPKAKEFLSYEPKPEFEEGRKASEEAAAEELPSKLHTNRCNL